MREKWVCEQPLNRQDTKSGHRGDNNEKYIQPEDGVYGIHPMVWIK
eukprot:UN13725